MAVDFSKYINSTGTHYISNSGHDENNQYNSGKAGDQTGKEWELKSWYNRPWTVVLRYPDSKVGLKIAELGISAALNNNIGYDQYQRKTYWAQLEKAGYDPSKITTACEEDCTAGVTANCKAVGYLMGIKKLQDLAVDTYSENMKSRFVSAGFKALTDKKYISETSYLLPGDILLYEGHHAATNITYGKKAEKSSSTVVSEQVNAAELVNTVEGAHNMICDVSKHQGNIDWDKLAPELAFCIIKASSGKGKDPYYDRNTSECKRLGVPFHAYHFLYCQSVVEAKKEAKLFADSVKGTGPLFYVLDVESESKIPTSNGKEIIRAFEDELRNNIGSNIHISIYIAHELYSKYSLDYSHYSYVWIPRYGPNKGTVLSSIKPSHPCDLWQYTSKGKIAGISGDADLNVLTETKPLEFFINSETKVNKDAPVTESETKAVSGAIEKLSDDTPGFTGKKLAEYCLNVYKDAWVYWYGTYGQKCSDSLYNSKKKQYADHYGSSRTAAYKKDIANGKRCADCVGLIKSYFWSGGDINTLPKYGTNHCPDVSANGMFNLCKQTGNISTIPDEPGIVVWHSGHIGVYVGGGYTVELMGFDYDCKKKKVTAGSWTKWGRLPTSMISYTNEPVVNPSDEGDRFLQNGSSGKDVKQLQTNLIKLGYDCGRWGADGDFGDATEAALEAFQKDHELTPNGIYDAATISALTAAMQAFEEPAKDPVKVKIVGGNCYVRTQPNTDGRKLGIAKSGSIWNYCGKTSENGWNMINYNGNFAWVSGKYSKLID